MKFTEEILEKTFAEMLGKECFPHHLGITIGRKPEIKELNDGIDVTIIANKQAEISEIAWSDFGITSERLRKSFGKASEKDLSNPIITLIILSLFPEISAEEIGLILGVSGRSVETYIKKLKEENLIERIGGKKEGFWQIIKQV